jgi:carbon-monoxide dehydrogenase medium subunit
MGGRAGGATGTVYLYFRSKEHVLLGLHEVFHRGMERAMTEGGAELLQRIERGDAVDHAAAVGILLDHMADYLVDHRRYCEVMARYMPEEAWRFLQHALESVRQDEDAKLLAGGQSLLAVMNYRLARPHRIIDIGGLDELRRVFEEPDSMLLGGLCTHRFIETDALVGRRLPLLREAARHIGHVAIRNRGTLGGTIAHADPAAELPAALLALQASVFVERHGEARREIPISDLYQGFYSTVLEHSDVITWVRVRTPGPRSGWGFAEVARRHGDFAEAGCAAVLEREGENDMLRLALFGVADKPLLFVHRTPLDEQLVWSDVADAIAEELAPAERPEYRRRLAAYCIEIAASDAHKRLEALEETVGRDG